MNKDESKELSIPSSMSREQIELIKTTVARGATDDELKLFLYTANRTGLDPLTKQIHFIKRKVKNSKTGQYEDIGTIQTGIDGYRVIASRNGLAGIDDVAYDSEVEKNPNKATVTVYRTVEGIKSSYTATARWNEYAQKFPDGNPMAMWAKMPYLMLGKVAESLALRKAFPNDLSGIYTTEEMSNADELKDEPKEPQNIEAKKGTQPATVEKPESVKILEKKKEVKKLVDDKVLNMLETKKEYEDYVKQQTGLDLNDANLDEIITRLKAL